MVTTGVQVRTSLVAESGVTLVVRLSISTSPSHACSWNPPALYEGESMSFQVIWKVIVLLGSLNAETSCGESVRIVAGRI